MKDTYDLGNGLEIKKMTEVHRLDLIDRMREDDRRECEVFQPVGMEFQGMEGWSIFLHGEMVGIWGIVDNDSLFSHYRSFTYLSTISANKMKLSYVKRSRDVVDWIFSNVLTDAYITHGIVLIDDRYTGAKRWAKRILGATCIGEVPVNRVKHGYWLVPRKMEA